MPLCLGQGETTRANSRDQRCGADWSPFLMAENEEWLSLPPCGRASYARSRRSTSRTDTVMITDISAPKSTIARQAEELCRRVSNDTLFNHCMRSYWFAELFAQQEGIRIDSELVFLSAVLHDLGL